MSNFRKSDSTIDDLIAIARDAGKAIAAIYNEAEVEVNLKSDNSPLTIADTTSHKIIIEGLQRLTPDIPIISEEGELPSWSERQKHHCYWLIDPLDGTKEFINRNGEFTVNIALIQDHRPVLGVVYAPVKEVLYYGELDSGAYKQYKDEEATKIEIAPLPACDDTWKVVGSRSHQSDEFKDFIQALPKVDLVSMGSSLKLCSVAEGSAHLYPRLGLTSEWDTAAAHAVVCAAGGEVFNLQTQAPLKYNTKESLLNPFFIVCNPGFEMNKVESNSEKNIVWQQTSVSKSQRANRFKQKPAIIWFTGLSGSGKSTTAIALEKKLFALGYSTYLLDGDNVRHGLCSDLGFNNESRVENIRRVGEVAKLFVDAGFIVITSFISPFLRERKMVREMVEPGEFIEVYMNTPLEECERRDPKGLYKKARNGEIKNFTGIDSPYEAPTDAEHEVCYTTSSDLDLIVNDCIKKLEEFKLLKDI